MVRNMFVNPSNIDPHLLTDEMNIMMLEVKKELKNISTDEDKIIYAKQKLRKYFKEPIDITKILAFKDCYEGNTGEILNIKDLLYGDGFITLADTANTLETLTPLLGIYFPE